MGQQRPGHARHLVGERHRHDLEGSPRQELREPGILPWIHPGRAATANAPTMSIPQLAISLLGDRSELLLCPRSNPSAEPARTRPESPWPGARFVQITEPKEVLPGFFLFTTRSEVPGTREMNEISLVIKTPKGGVLVVGCSHPGIERLVEAATKIDSQLYEVFGGFHLVDIPDDKVTEMVTAFRDKWKIERMAAGHCTGQFAFAELIRVFGPRFDPAGVGSVISLPS